MRSAAVIASLALCAAAATLHAADETPIGEPTALVAFALDKLRTYHVNRSRLDWSTVEAAALEKAQAARSNGDLYDIIDGVIRDLGEPHSFLARPRSSLTNAPPASDAPRKPPEIRASLVGDVGYIDLPTFAGGGKREVAFAQDVRASLLKLDSAPLCGWIVDLRSNEGGNMHAALAGLGRILGEGRLGSVVGSAGPQFWHYRSNRMIVSNLGDIENEPVDDAFTSGTSPLVQGVRQTVTLPSDSEEVRQFELPVAVLIGKDTMSSGEGIAVSFIGRPLTRTFGKPTRGRSSANVGFRLSGGGMLIVTYGPFADRNGTIHGPRVVPDQEITSGSARSTLASSDETVASAVRWIHGRKMCPPERFGK
ncbi:MAG: S41 family peptidase [Burkholderiales bacterium]